MVFRTVAVAAMAFGLASGAFAQSDSNSAGSGAGGKGDSPMQMWKGPIGDAFFSDMTSGKLRPQADIHKRWAKLTKAQKNKVHDDCKTVDAQNPTGSMAEACKMVKSM